jgi:hypothetical protein
LANLHLLSPYPTTTASRSNIEQAHLAFQLHSSSTPNPVRSGILEFEIRRQADVSAGQAPSYARKN